MRLGRFTALRSWDNGHRAGKKGIDKGDTFTVVVNTCSTIDRRNGDAYQTLRKQLEKDGYHTYFTNLNEGDWLVEDLGKV